LRRLPSTRSVPTAALVKRDKLGNVLGPTLGALRPGARALGPSLQATQPFFEETTPVVQNQLRPFARDTLPVVTTLRPTAANLAKITPHLTSSLNVADHLLNELAYNPPGRQEGYLFWAAWANHLGTSLFNLQDANGPVRRGLVMASCSSLITLSNIGKANELLGVLAQLLSPPTPAQICGRPAIPGATR